MAEQAICVPVDTLKTEYFKYLCDMININQEKNSFFLLAQDLHKIIFYSVVSNDDNRIKDGLALRTAFISATSYVNYDAIEGPCTFFEFLIGLAVRMAFILESTNDEDKYPIYFHELLENCGLNEATDDNYFSSEFNSEYVRSVVDRILERRYKKDGSGGLFPIKTWIKADGDQRDVEIWYQMARYLIDRE